MAAAANSWGNEYLTTCIVPIKIGGVVSQTHHGHFSVGPRPENGCRPILYHCHPIEWCPGHTMRQWQIVDLTRSIKLGFDPTTITDWNHDEEDILTEFFGPKSQAHYDAVQRRQAEVDARFLAAEERMRLDEQRRLEEERYRLEKEQRHREEEQRFQALMTAAEVHEDAHDEEEQGYESDY